AVAPRRPLDDMEQAVAEIRRLFAAAGTGPRLDAPPLWTQGGARPAGPDPTMAIANAVERTANSPARNPPKSHRRPPATPHSKPDIVRLAVTPGVAPSGKPPVRIFLGTEPAQHRAERVFVWSVETARDPSRVYEIHLMKDLEGFQRRWWTTGFTNYRLGVP